VNIDSTRKFVLNISTAADKVYVFEETEVS